MLGASELQRYFPERRMRIYVGTWNMGGMRETPSSLDNLLLPEMIEYAQDAYVIGAQEAISNRYKSYCRVCKFFISFFEKFNFLNVLFNSFFIDINAAGCLILPLMSLINNVEMINSNNNNNNSNNNSFCHIDDNTASLPKHTYRV